MAQIIKTMDMDKKYRPWHEDGYYILPGSRVFAIEYDGKHVIELMEEKTSFTLAHARDVIAAEGGYVDENGVIHRGTAQYKLAIPPHEEGEELDLREKERTGFAKKTQIAFGALLGKTYLGKTILDVLTSPEVEKREQETGKEIKKKDLLKMMGKYDYFCGKDGIIRLVAGRKPTRDEDAMNIYERLTK